MVITAYRGEPKLLRQLQHLENSGRKQSPSTCYLLSVLFGRITTSKSVSTSCFVVLILKEGNISSLTYEVVTAFFSKLLNIQGIKPSSKVEQSSGEITVFMKSHFLVGSVETVMGHTGIHTRM